MVQQAALSRLAKDKSAGKANCTSEWIHDRSLMRRKRFNFFTHHFHIENLLFEERSF